MKRARRPPVVCPCRSDAGPRCRFVSGFFRRCRCQVPVHPDAISCGWPGHGTRAARARYDASAKGQARKKRYDTGPKGRACWLRWSDRHPRRRRDGGT